MMAFSWKCGGKATALGWRWNRDATQRVMLATSARLLPSPSLPKRRPCHAHSKASRNVPRVAQASNTAVTRRSRGARGAKRRRTPSKNGTKTLLDCLQDTLRLSSRHFLTVFKTLLDWLQDMPGLSSRHSSTVFNTLPDCLQDEGRPSSSWIAGFFGILRVRMTVATATLYSDVMKRLLLASLLLVASAAQAKEVLPWIENDYTRAIARAKSADLPVFVEAWAPW